MARDSHPLQADSETDVVQYIANMYAAMKKLSKDSTGASHKLECRGKVHLFH